MHLAVQRDIVDHLAPVRFICRSEVVDVHSRELRHQPIGTTGRNTPHDKVVDALLTPAAYHVISLFQLRQEIRDFVGIMLQVRSLDPSSTKTSAKLAPTCSMTPFRRSYKAVTLSSSLWKGTTMEYFGISY